MRLPWINNTRTVILARRGLQIAVGLGALVPIAAGLAGILLGPDMAGAEQETPVSLDSHFRYLSGLLLGIGVAFWITLPDIQNKSSQFRLLTAIVFTGGLGRLISLIEKGIPDTGMQFGLAMELIVTPLLALWQYAVARRTHNS